jgi:hypothetical protein
MLLHLGVQESVQWNTSPTNLACLDDVALVVDIEIDPPNAQGVERL